MNARNTIFLLVAWLVCVSTVSAAEMKIGVADASAAAGSEVSVPISASGGPKLAAARVILTYDADALEVEDVLKAKQTKTAADQLGHTVNKAGRVTMNFISKDGVEADGELFLVKFKVKDGASGESELKIEKVLAWRADNRVEVLADTSDGKFTVGSGLPLPLPWLIGIGAAVLLLLLLLVFGRRKKA